MKKGFWISLFLAGFLVILNPQMSSSEQEAEPVDAPDFTLTGLDGDTISLSGLEGKAVFLNFWATWCGPCKKEMPHFNEAYARYKDKGLFILGISIDSGEKVVRRFIEKREINYPLAMATPQLLKDYQPGRAVPVTIIIDRKGKIWSKHIGYIDKETLERYVKDLIEND